LKVAERKPKGQPSNEPPLQPLSKPATTQKEAVKTQPINKPPQKYQKDHWFIVNIILIVF